MTTFCLNWDSLDHQLPGLREIAQEWPDRFSEDGRKIEFVCDEKIAGMKIQWNADTIEVKFSETRDAYRALGILLGEVEVSESKLLEESTPFSSLGVMLDVSRNAVLKSESVKFYLRRFALMGINSVQLYMEDIYELPEEPFFGYGRGPYSPEELREMDDYAAIFGIELIPCIQTLGHLEQILQWPPYASMTDVGGVLLIGDEKVHALIRKMLETLSGCFRSRRIHIGMDEAHGVGSGRYRKLHGECRPFDILNQHLAVVTEVCDSLGLKPMMWSDMYFRIGSAENNYYDREAKIPADVPKLIPVQVELVYWDYYHDEQDFYEEWIDRHQAMGKTPIFAAGGWNWGRLWTRLPGAFPLISTGMRAARKKSLSEAFITLWGDDGAECDPFSILPAIQHFAECAYGYDAEGDHLERRFFGACGVRLNPLLLGSQVDAFPGDSEPGTLANFSKWILWHDPVLSFLAPSIPSGMAEHYRQLVVKLDAVPAEETSIHISLAQALARVLAGKTRLHLEVREAYQAKNHAALKSLQTEVLSAVIRDLEILWELHRKIWQAWHKPFGWEVIDRRYGGTMARLKSLDGILERYQQDPELGVPEFEYELQKIESGSYFGFARTCAPTIWR